MGSVVVSFKVRREFLEIIDAVARREGKTRSELIREAIERYLDVTDSVVVFETRRVRIIDFPAGAGR